MAEHAKRCLETIREFPLPVIAALNGDALGGGAELAVACGFRLMEAHAHLGFIQGRLNISTAWGGGVDLLNLCGTATALRLMSRAELIDAKTAVSLGLAEQSANSEIDFPKVLENFLKPIRRQKPKVLRTFKLMVNSYKRGLCREELDRLETKHFAHHWVQDDHWDAAEKILSMNA